MLNHTENQGNSSGYSGGGGGREQSVKARGAELVRDTPEYLNLSLRFLATKEAVRGSL